MLVRLDGILQKPWHFAVLHDKYLGLKVDCSHVIKDVLSDMSEHLKALLCKFPEVFAIAEQQRLGSNRSINQAFHFDT